MSQTSHTSTEYASLGQVLDDAMHEICTLEEKSSLMQDVLNQLHTGIVEELKMPVSFKDQKLLLNTADVDLEQLRSENKMLAAQLNDFKKLSKSVSEKLVSAWNNGNALSHAKNLQHNYFVKLKKKLSTSSLLIQKLVERDLRPSKTITDLLCSNKLGEKELNNVDCSNLSNTDDELRKQLSDALEKNVRWQNYNIEREHYVSIMLSKYNQTCSELQKTKEKLSLVTSNPDRLALEQRRYFDKLLVNARQELETQRGQTLQITTELAILNDKHKEEVNRLESKMEKLRKRYEEQREALAALNADYRNERRKSINNAEESKEKQSQIQLFQRQVQLFSEDFRAERKEKEIAQYEVEFLKQKVVQLQSEIEKFNKKPRLSVQNILGKENLVRSHKQSHRPYQGVYDESRQTRHKASPPAYIFSRSHTPTSDTSKISEMSPIMTRRRTMPMPKQRSTREKSFKKSTVSKTEEVNCKASKRKDKVSSRKPSSEEVPGTDVFLQCPNCDKQYNVYEHTLLLEHIDVCGD